MGYLPFELLNKKRISRAIGFNFIFGDRYTRVSVSLGDRILDMNALWEFFGVLLGLGAETKELTFLQISLRGVIVFAATLVMVRLSSKRSLAEKTAFDAVLIVILASMLARAINGSAPFFPTLGTGFVLVILYRLLGAAAYYSHRFGILIKGKPVLLVQNGRLERKNMRRSYISEHDIEEDMRLNARTDDLSQIKVARVERSGDISFIKTEAAA